MSLEQDLPELLEFEDPNVVAMLIVDCIKVSGAHYEVFTPFGGRSGQQTTLVHCRKRSEVK